MLTNDDPGYVDLTSPAGIGIGALVYNYDGDVYASDEGRMLAEMGDTTFRLGNLHEDSYAEIMLSDALLDPLEESFTLERSDVQRLRLRALLRRRSRLPPRDAGRLRRPQADIGLLPAQHGASSGCCSTDTRPIRRRAQIFLRLGQPMIAAPRPSRDDVDLASRSSAGLAARRAQRTPVHAAITGYLVEAETPDPDGFDLYVTKPGAQLPDRSSQLRRAARPTRLPRARRRRLALGGRPRIRVLWRHESRQNSVLLTERCDNYCLMCSQPPKDANDDWLLDEAFELVRLLPPRPADIGFTGGEPTLYGDRLLDLLTAVPESPPGAGVHVLSNGRRFADLDFAVSLRRGRQPAT